jgi:hypothetical protein
MADGLQLSGYLDIGLSGDQEMSRVGFANLGLHCGFTPPQARAALREPGENTGKSACATRFGFWVGFGIGFGWPLGGPRATQASPKGHARVAQE